MTNTKIAAPRVRLRKTPSLSRNRPSTFERMTTSSEADVVLPRDRVRSTTGFLPGSYISALPVQYANTGTGHSTRISALGQVGAANFCRQATRAERTGREFQSIQSLAANGEGA